MYIRKQIFEGIERESAFLWGARQTGKIWNLIPNNSINLYNDKT